MSAPGCVNASSSVATTSMSFPEPMQLESLVGSLSRSCWIPGMPVHWFVSTTSRRCVAVTGCGRANVRISRFGATGRGFTPGKASSGLV